MRYIFLLVAFFNYYLYAQPYNQIYNSFSSDEMAVFEQANDFEIIAGSLKVNAYGKFSDGIYKLKNVDIEQVSKDLYNVSLVFRYRKKKYLSFSKNVDFQILYDRKKLWIKYKNKIYKYYIPKNIQRRYQDNSCDDGYYDLHVKVKDMNLTIRIL